MGLVTQVFRKLCNLLWFAEREGVVVERKLGFDGVDTTHLQVDWVTIIPLAGSNAREVHSLTCPDDNCQQQDGTSYHFLTMNRTMIGEERSQATDSAARDNVGSCCCCTDSHGYP